MKNVYQKYGFMIVISGFVVLLDQWTKSIVRANLPFGSMWLPDWLEWLSPYARFVNWHNSGAAFGLFQNGSMVFTVLAFIVIAAIVYYFPQVEEHDWTLRLAMSMQLGGAMGNLIDRLLHDGKVTDFISVGTFPVFNVADASISVGTAVLLLGVYFQERAAQRAKSNLGGQSPAPEITSE